MGVAIALDVAVVFVLAETAPKTWAVLDPERVALAVARPVRAVAAVAPLRWAARALIGLTNVVLPGKGLKHGPFVSSDDELLAVAELGVEEGVIEEEERALIESIITFGDTIVREVMVPRPDMVTVAAQFRVADVMEVFLLNGYSRMPVCREGLDDVIGLAYAKDLMGAERDGKQGVPVLELVRPARFVPETKRVPDMFREMQRDKFHMAIVVDEYGGTAGLVTLEDLIEELVGEITDEFDIDDPIVEPLPGGGIRVHARTPVDEVNDLLGARLPEGDWDTVGGLVYDRIGHVPVEGESVDVPGWRLTAQRIQGRRIGRVSIVPLDRKDAPASSAPGRSGEGQRERLEAERAVVRSPLLAGAHGVRVGDGAGGDDLAGPESRRTGLLGDHSGEVAERERRAVQHVGPGAAVHEVSVAPERGLELRQRRRDRVTVRVVDRHRCADGERALWNPTAAMQSAMPNRQPG